MKAVDTAWAPEGQTSEGLLLCNGETLPWEFIYGLIFHLHRGSPYHTFRTDRVGKYLRGANCNYATMAHYVEKHHSSFVFCL